MGIVSLTIVDVIAILLLLVVISAKNIIAILSISVLVIVITLIILYCKKVKKNPLKYRKYFYNLKSANINNEKSNTIEYNLGYDFKSNLFGEKISVRCEWNGEEIEIIVTNNKIIHVEQYDGDIGYWKKKEI
mgnify:CR=1 FL=1